MVIKNKSSKSEELTQEIKKLHVDLYEISVKLDMLNQVFGNYSEWDSARQKSFSKGLDELDSEMRTVQWKLFRCKVKHKLSKVGIGFLRIKSVFKAG